MDNRYTPDTKPTLALTTATARYHYFHNKRPFPLVYQMGYGLWITVCELRCVDCSVWISCGLRCVGCGVDCGVDCGADSDLDCGMFRVGYRVLSTLNMHPVNRIARGQPRAQAIHGWPGVRGWPGLPH